MIQLIGAFVILAVLGGLPAFLIGQRRGVRNPGVAFIPLAGPLIVLLWSIERTAWMGLLIFVPPINVFFAFWLLFALPGNHGRSLLWALILFVPIVGIYTYALTVPEARRTHRTHGFTRTVVR